MVIGRVATFQHPMITRVGDDRQAPWNMLKASAYPSAIRVHGAPYAPHRRNTLLTYAGVSRFRGIPPARETAPGPAL